MSKEGRGDVKPEVLAAITAALAVYGYLENQDYRITTVRQTINPWKKRGIVDNMLVREMNIPLKGTI